MLSVFEFYLIVVNLIAFFQYGSDKSRAVHGEWRISEKRLIIIALLGGSLGAWLGMRTFHHKIRKLKFRLIIPLSLILHTYIFYLFVR